MKSSLETLRLPEPLELEPESELEVELPELPELPELGADEVVEEESIDAIAEDTEAFHWPEDLEPAVTVTGAAETVTTAP